MELSNRRFPAPVKLNLFLHVIGRRADGYHNLQTLFQLLDYGDELSFALRADEDIHLQVKAAAPVPVAVARSLAHRNNMVVRAAHALKEFCGNRQPGVDIVLYKRIPPGTGLGSGSSDAATTLHVLNQLWSCRLDHLSLLEIGRRLGADVPVFINGKSAWAEGIGDRLTAWTLPEVWYAVLMPAVKVSTKQAFAALKLSQDCRLVTPADYQSGATRNVFEYWARQHYPEIAAAFDWLGQSGQARLSGSGSSVFAVFPEEEQARAIIRRMPPTVSGFAAKGVAESPLRAENLTGC